MSPHVRPPADDVYTAGLTIPTAGGVSIVIQGSALGIDGSIVYLMYSGGLLGQARHVYNSTDCSVVEANVLLSCMAAPGVGGNYTFSVIVGGGASAPSLTTLSYTSPTIALILGGSSSTEVRYIASRSPDAPSC